MKNPNINTWKTSCFHSFDTGTQYYEQERYIEAIPEFNKTLKTNPKRISAANRKYTDISRYFSLLLRSTIIFFLVSN